MSFQACKGITHQHIVYLSSQTVLVNKGLNFSPSPKSDHPAKIIQDFLLFDRKLRWKYHCYSTTDSNSDSSESMTEEYDILRNITIIPNSGWTPLSRQDPFLDTYRSSTLHDLQ